jgi:hypothetical protein
MSIPLHGGAVSYQVIHHARQESHGPKPDRFALLEQMWRLMLNGSHSPSTILDLGTNKWGLRTRKRRKSGGYFLSLSTRIRDFLKSLLWRSFPLGREASAGEAQTDDHLGRI